MTALFHTGQTQNDFQAAFHHAPSSMHLPVGDNAAGEEAVSSQSARMHVFIWEGAIFSSRARA